MRATQLTWQRSRHRRSSPAACQRRQHRVGEPRTTAAPRRKTEQRRPRSDRRLRHVPGQHTERQLAGTAAAPAAIARHLRHPVKVVEQTGSKRQTLTRPLVHDFRRNLTTFLVRSFLILATLRCDTDLECCALKYYRHLLTMIIRKIWTITCFRRNNQQA